jgi:hypothetical protein
MMMMMATMMMTTMMMMMMTMMMTMMMMMMMMMTMMTLVVCQTVFHNSVASLCAKIDTSGNGSIEWLEFRQHKKDIDDAIFQIQEYVGCVPFASVLLPAWREARRASTQG